MLVKIKSATYIGLEAQEIDIEVDICTQGLPKFKIVGMPTKATDESIQRITTAITNSGQQFPRKKITVNLAPADIQKEGACYDLPIAVGILSIILKVAIPKDSLFFGELSLDGSLRKTRGIFLFALLAKELNLSNLYIPASSLPEARCVNDINIFPVNNLKEIVNHINNIKPIISEKGSSTNIKTSNSQTETDFADVIDNDQCKRALTIVAAGGHNILLTGTPGTGKTMMTRALAGILPPLNQREVIEVMKINSAAGNDISDLKRPFRAPHHTTSTVGLIGGGSKPLPGEVSLAHKGVLFLDEFSEFPQYVLDALRQPLEDNCISISRSKGRITYPADFILVAATNPCPCGYLGHPQISCKCTTNDIIRYKKKISGPILDRIDLQVNVEHIDISKLTKNIPVNNISSANMLKVIISARKTQLNRFKDLQISTNSEMTNKNISTLCRIEPNAQALLTKATTKFALSTRTYFRLIKIAQTIADLDQSDIIKINHISEAIQFRLNSKNV